MRYGQAPSAMHPAASGVRRLAPGGAGRCPAGAGADQKREVRPA